MLGSALAYGAVRVLVAAAPARPAAAGRDLASIAVVLLFAFAVSVVCGALFGLIPVLKYGGPHLATAIRHGGRTLSQSRERHRARSTLVVVQVALALVLLVGFGPDDPDVPGDAAGAARVHSTRKNCRR